MTEPSDSGAPRAFPDAREDLARWDRQPETPQTMSPSYRLAFSDDPGGHILPDAVYPGQPQPHHKPAIPAMPRPLIRCSRIELAHRRLVPLTARIHAGRPARSRVQQLHARIDARMLQVGTTHLDPMPAGVCRQRLS